MVDGVDNVNGVENEPLTEALPLISRFPFDPMSPPEFWWVLVYVPWPESQLSV